MRVCHLSSAHSSRDVRILHKQCVSLAAAGHEVYFVAQGKSEIFKGVHIVGLPKLQGGRLKRMTKRVELYRELEEC